MAPLTHEQKITIFKAYAQEKKIPRAFTSIPTVMFISLGQQMPPIIFCKPWQIALSLGVNFAVGWGLAMHFMSWQRKNMPISLQVSAAVMAGALFGFSMAIYYKTQKKKYGLTTWEEFKG
ncbi:DUF6404 family protein [Bdellovibrio bacteriovorus]|uniref:DUF6404 family protein n=1 Tax=Bdellovibrio bacteriovorus TaxID=959 RepID=UPI0035A8463E